MLNSTVENKSFPNYFEISSIYPNPFNSATKIEVEHKFKQVVAHPCILLDIRGQKRFKQSLMKKWKQETYLFNWNSNQNPSGIYFSVLEDK